MEQNAENMDFRLPLSNGQQEIKDKDPKHVDSKDAKLQGIDGFVSYLSFNLDNLC